MISVVRSVVWTVLGVLFMAVACFTHEAGYVLAGLLSFVLSELIDLNAKGNK